MMQSTEQLGFLAARTEGSPRMFSPAHPTLDLTLGPTTRLAAVAWVTPAHRDDPGAPPDPGQPCPTWSPGT